MLHNLYSQIKDYPNHGFDKPEHAGDYIYLRAYNDKVILCHRFVFNNCVSSSKQMEPENNSLKIDTSSKALKYLIKYFYIQRVPDKLSIYDIIDLIDLMNYLKCHSCDDFKKYLFNMFTQLLTSHNWLTTLSIFYTNHKYKYNQDYKQMCELIYQYYQNNLDQLSIIHYNTFNTDIKNLDVKIQRKLLKLAFLQISHNSLSPDYSSDEVFEPFSQMCSLHLNNKNKSNWHYPSSC